MEPLDGDGGVDAVERRFAEAGYELRLRGHGDVWQALWLRPGQLVATANFAVGATRLEAARRALADLERKLNALT